MYRQLEIISYEYFKNIHLYIIKILIWRHVYVKVKVWIEFLQNVLRIKSKQWYIQSKKRIFSFKFSNKILLSTNSNTFSTLRSITVTNPLFLKYFISFNTFYRAVSELWIYIRFYFSEKIQGLIHEQLLPYFFYLW